MVSLGLLLALAAPGSLITGVVHCEQAGKPVEIRVFAGSPAPWGLTPQGPPLATTQVPCGTPFRLEVAAPPPWRLEAHAPGHMAAAFSLTEATDVPAVWLPRGSLRRVEVTGSWQGTLRLWGYVANPRPWGRWQAVIPSARLERPGKLEFQAAKGNTVVLWGQDEEGAFARWELSGESQKLQFAPSRVTVRVVDPQGQPVAGAQVVAERAPSGAECAPMGREWRGYRWEPASGRWWPGKKGWVLGWLDGRPRSR